MIRHIVWWTLKDEAEGKTAAQNAERIKAMGEALIDKVPSLKSIEIGIDIKETTTLPAQVVLVSTHEDMAGLKAYAEHPEHLKLGALIKATTSSRQAIDYEV